MKRPLYRSGFTIVELLIVVVVIAVLAAVVIVAYNGIRERAIDSSVQSAVSQAAKKVMVHAVENADQFPGALSTVGVNDTDSTKYQYSFDNTAGPRTFCVSATSGGVSYHQNNTSSAKPMIGVCPGHNTVALDCPSGYIQVPGNTTFGTSDFCVMKYEAKIQGNDNGQTAYVASMVPESRPTGTPWTNISQVQALNRAQAACAGCGLISEAQWMTIAANVLGVPSNWSSGVVGTGYIYSGHNDNSPSTTLAASATDSDGYVGTGNSAVSGANQRRTLTLTNGEVIWDFAGNAWDLTSSSVAGGQQAGIAGEPTWAWKEWTNTSISWNGLPASSRPSAISATVGGWTSSRGIGQLFSWTSFGSTCAYFRGGSFLDTAGAGVLALNHSAQVTSFASGIGFRVAR